MTTPDTVTTTGDDPRRWAVLGANISVLLLNYGDRAAIGVAAPLIIHEFGFSETVMGFIMSAFALTYAPACLIGGALADRFGPRRTMAGAVVWWSIFTALTALCFNVATFVGQRMLFGLGEGPQGSITARTMSNWFAKREYGTAVGLTFAANPLGAAIGTPVVTLILVATNHRWQIPFLILGALGTLVALFWYVIVRDHPRQTSERGYGQAAVDATRSNADKDTTDGPVPSLARTLASWPLIANALAFFGFSWILFMFLSWYPTYLTDVQHVRLEQVAWQGAVPWVAGAVGTALGGIGTDALVRRFGSPVAPRKWTAVLSLAAAAALCLCLQAIHTAGAAVALFTIVLLLLYLTNAQFFAIVRDLVHPARVGGATGFVHFVANLAAILAPVVTGYLIDEQHSWNLAFGLAAAIAVFGAVALATTRRPARSYS